MSLLLLLLSTQTLSQDGGGVMVMVMRLWGVGWWGGELREANQNGAIGLVCMNV